jgi:hypothetical protein
MPKEWQKEAEERRDKLGYWQWDEGTPLTSSVFAEGVPLLSRLVIFIKVWRMHETRHAWMVEYLCIS